RNRPRYVSLADSARNRDTAPDFAQPASREPVPGRRREPGRRSGEHRLAGAPGRPPRPPRPRSERPGLGFRTGGDVEAPASRRLGAHGGEERRQPEEGQPPGCMVFVRRAGPARVPLSVLGMTFDPTVDGQGGFNTTVIDTFLPGSYGGTIPEPGLFA